MRPPELCSCSFLVLLEIHASLDGLFLQHQEALLDLDLPLARARLHEFEQQLRSHMQIEETLLLPIYQRSGPIRGGSVDLFTSEHRKMQELLARFDEEMARLDAEHPRLRRQVLRLLEREAVFKHLAEHHDLREQNILYPTLDRVTTETERRELLQIAVRDVAADEE